MNNCYPIRSLSDILEDVREAIKSDKGLSISLLANEMCLSRQMLSYLLHEKRPMKSEYLVYLIYRTGMKVSY